jgi:thiamine biosynthesis lipoprotein ApbE
VNLRSSQSEFISISFFGKEAALCDALATAAFNAQVSVWDEWVQTFPTLQYAAITKSGSFVTSLSSV